MAEYYKRYIPISNKKIRLLDIMCGTGDLLSEFSSEKYDASDYVLKPFDQADIHRALDKAYRSQATPSTEGPSLTDTGLLAVPGDERVYMISPDDIVLLTVDGHQLRMETVQRTYEFSDSLAAWEQKLPEGTFMKTHRSFLINLQKVREVQPYFNQTYQVTMANGSKVPVSRTYTKLFKQRLNIE